VHACNLQKIQRAAKRPELLFCFSGVRVAACLSPTNPGTSSSSTLRNGRQPIKMIKCGYHHILSQFGTFIHHSSFDMFLTVHDVSVMKS
jgi:hypothetical protein